MQANINGQESIETNLITLTRHVLHDQTKLKDAHGDLTLLLVSIQLGCKFVSSQVRRAGLANLYALLSHIEPAWQEKITSRGNK